MNNNSILKGIGAQSLSQIIIIIQSTLLIPLFLNAWGSNIYGKWLILNSTLSYLSLLDLGGQNYIGNLITQDYTNNDYVEFKKKLSIAISFFILVSLFFLLLILIYLFVFPIFNLQLFNFKFNKSDTYVLLILSMTYLISVPTGVFISVYRATNNFAIMTMIGNFTRIIILICSIITLIFKGNILIYTLTFFTSNIFAIIFMIIDAKNRISIINNLNISFSNSMKGFKFLKGSLQYLIISIANLFNSQGFIIIISIFTSPILVAIYSTHKMIGNFVLYFGSILQAPLWPKMTIYYAKGKINTLKYLMFSSLKINMFLTGLSILFLWIILPYIYPYWTNKNLKFDPLLLSIIFIQSYLFSFWNTTSWPLIASNKTELLSKFSFSNGIVSILISIFLIPKYGLYGAAFSSLFGDIICGLIIFPFISMNFFKIKVFSYYFKLFENILLLLPIISMIILYKFFNSSFYIFMLFFILIYFFILRKYLQKNLSFLFKN